MAIKHLVNHSFGIHEIDSRYRDLSRAFHEFCSDVGQCLEQEALPQLMALAVRVRDACRSAGRGGNNVGICAPGRVKSLQPRSRERQ